MCCRVNLDCDINTHGGGLIRWLGKKSAQKAVATGLPEIYPRLWRFCLVQTKTRHGADDLAQAACVRAMDQADKFQPGSNLDRWVFTIARRIWLNEIRANTVRRGSGLVSVDDIEISDARPNTEVNILAREVFDKIQGLPEAHRVTTLLVYLEGYSYKEAAELLGIPIGTVMSRLAAARKAIKAQTDDRASTEQGSSDD
ncbi:MAG: RNA polymerase sigma factor [Pseudomonadota bacterium]